MSMTSQGLHPRAVSDAPPAEEPANSISYDRTPICIILHALNRKCVAAAQAGNHEEARRFARIATDFEEAVTESRK
jgi:hypothetical protein